MARNVVVLAGDCIRRGQTGAKYEQDTHEVSVEPKQWFYRVALERSAAKWNSRLRKPLRSLCTEDAH